jgi:hypothetical protein
MMDNNIYYTVYNIYGIKIYSYIDNDYIILFEQKHNTIMNNEMMKEVKVFYENLNENKKKNVKFQIYIECKSIDNEEKCMIWWNIPLNEFIKEFGI